MRFFYKCAIMCGKYEIVQFGAVNGKLCGFGAVNGKLCGIAPAAPNMCPCYHIVVLTMRF